MSELPPALRNQLQRLQQLQDQLQAIILRKQQWQLKLAELENAIKELENAKEDVPVFKIVGSIMILSDKNSLLNELKEEKELTEARISTLDKQERLLRKQLEDLQKRINQALASRGTGTIAK